MSKSPATAIPKTNKAAPTIQPPVLDVRRSPDQEADRSSTAGQRVVNAVSGGNLQILPTRVGALLAQMKGATATQRGVLRRLQQGYGNQYVGQVIQAKLTVGQPGDVYEEEADRVADRVMRMPEPDISPSASVSNVLKQKASKTEEKRKETWVATEPQLPEAASNAIELRATEGMPLFVQRPASEFGRLFVQRQMDKRQAVKDWPERRQTNVTHWTTFPATTANVEALSSGMRVHEGPAAAARAHRAGTIALVRDRDVYLSPLVGRSGWPQRSNVLTHERIHVAQSIVGRSGHHAPHAALERQAANWHPGSRETLLGADPNEELGFWPLVVAAAAAAYVLLRPNVANAPGPGDRVRPSVPLTQVAGEAISLFLLPEFILARTGLTATGFMLVGASSSVGMRASGDVGRGQVSAPVDYLADAAGGAVMGRLAFGPTRAFTLGVRGPQLFRTMGLSGMGMGLTLRAQQDLYARELSSLESYATYGGVGTALGLGGGVFILGGDRLAGRLVFRSDVARGIASEGMNAEQVAALFASRRPDRLGRAGEAWLNARGLEQFYRGQMSPTSRILSPFNREQLGFSEEMYQAYLAAGQTPETLAAQTARWSDEAVPGAIQGLDPRMGATGIPLTRNPSVAADFARTGGGTTVVVSHQGRIYVVQLPRGTAINAGSLGWPNRSPVELEHIVFHEIPSSAIIGRIRVPDELPSLVGDGILLPRRTP